MINEQTATTKNTCGLIGMIFSIIGLVFCITIIGTILGRFFLFIGFILGLIGVFSKPRGKAITAILIPIIVCCFYFCLGLYIWSGVKPSFNEFKDRIEDEISIEENKEMFNDDQFGVLVEKNCQNITNESFEELRENSDEGGVISKISNITFGHLKSCLSVSIEEYKALENNEVDKVEEDEQVAEEPEEEITEDKEIEEIIEKKEEVKQPTSAFSAEELKEIDDFLNILE